MHETRELVLSYIYTDYINTVLIIFYSSCATFLT